MQTAHVHTELKTSGACCAEGHEQTIRRVAGGMIIASLLLAWLIHPGWLGLAAFVGLNLFQSSFTGFCPLQNILEWNHRRRPAKA